MVLTMSITPNHSLWLFLAASQRAIAFQTRDQHIMIRKNKTLPPNMVVPKPILYIFI